MVSAAVVTSQPSLLSILSCTRWRLLDPALLAGGGLLSREGAMV
jgi:hypothetical protein